MLEIKQQNKADREDIKVMENKKTKNNKKNTKIQPFRFSDSKTKRS